MIGQAISHYRITGKLGEGGMGVVYKAEDTKLERSVALKFLAPHLLQDAEASRRFIREAKAAAALDHPNICTVHEIDEVDGRTFIAMAFIEGDSLEKKIEAGPLKLKDALDAAIQTAQGLQAAHEKKIVHRDIKPANLMVTLLGSAQRRVIIMDFGLAQLSDRSKLTELDSALGTVAYMSPEQTYGQELDHRTDLWALGVVIYEMVTGQRPFQGHYEKAVMYSITNEEPEPMTALRTGVPMELEWIVGKCLAKELDERCQNAAELIVDLRGVVKKLESGRSTIRSVSRGAAPVRTGALAGPTPAETAATVAAPANEQDVVAAGGGIGEGPDGGPEAQRGTAGSRAPCRGSTLVASLGCRIATLDACFRLSLLHEITAATPIPDFHHRLAGGGDISNRQARAARAVAGRNPPRLRGRCRRRPGAVDSPARLIGAGTSAGHRRC